MAYKKVDMLFQKPISESYNVKVGEELITTTDEHPFWVHEKGWVKTKDLEVGDLLETSDGNLLPIDAIEVKEEHTTVYNFRVKDFHTYYVSNLSILTHNSNCIPLSFYKDRTEGHYDLKLAHAPSKSPSQILRDELTNANLGKPPVADPITGWNAHHIVAAGANNQAARDARLILKHFGIDTNSSAIGVWLPKVKGYSHYNLPDYDGTMLVVATHNGGHTKNYYEYVFKQLQRMNIEYRHLPLEQRQTIAADILQGIREDLTSGRLFIGRYIDN